MSWHHGMLGMFDLETTGIDVRECRIVTGYVATVLGRNEGRRQIVGADVLVNPGVSIPIEASRVHGVTDEMAQAKGVEPAGVINLIAEEISRCLRAGIPVVTFNGAFDFSTLYHECLRWNVATVAERLGLPPAAPVGPIIDAYVLDKQVDPYRKGSRKLENIAAHYGVPLANAHTADADAMASVRVAVAIAEAFPDIARMDLRTLHHAQKGWRAQQAASLQHHFRTKGGKPDAYVDPCWPACVDLTHPSG